MTRLEDWASRSWNMLSNFDRFAVKLFKESKSYRGGVDRYILIEKKNCINEMPKSG